jgi:type IV secretory pathway protease TraF
LELGLFTVDMLHRFARMGTTVMRRMPVRLTVTTARVGSLAEYSSGQDPGSMAMVADIGAMAVTTVTVVTTGVAVITDVGALLAADRLLLRIGVPQAVQLAAR